MIREKRTEIRQWVGAAFGLATGVLIGIWNENIVLGVALGAALAATLVAAFRRGKQEKEDV